MLVISSSDMQREIKVSLRLPYGEKELEGRMGEVAGADGEEKRREVAKWLELKRRREELLCCWSVVEKRGLVEGWGGLYRG